MALHRNPDWPFKLRCYLEAQADSVFAWGSNDCCIHATSWIRLCTDVDVFADFRGLYQDAASASALIQRVTGSDGTIEAAAEHVTAQHGIEQVPLLCAQRGDVVLMDGSDGQMLGVVSLHPGRAAFLTARGLVHLKTSACKKAWRI